MRKSFIVIGAGLGGLATALRLAHRGHQVTVLEKTDQVGGRNREHRLNDCHFDGGPSLMMMLDPFRKLYRDVGERMEDHLQISLCDPSYRVFFADKSRIDGTPNVALMLEQIERLCGPAEAAKYPQFLGELAKLYHVAIPHFVRNNFPNPWSYASPAQLQRVLSTRMLGNLSKKVARTFKDERLQMLFSFQTMYLGLSPYDSPWVYGTLTYMEYGEGIWYPQGGLPAISQSVARLAEERGATIRLNAPVQRVDGKSVVLESGETLSGDIIISNSDLPYTERALENKTPKSFKYSCSAYVMYIDYQGTLPEMLHHNVFFGKDFRGNLNSLFHELKTPEDPAFYACISKRSQADRAPSGHENLFILVPCPNLDLPWDAETERITQNAVFDRLSSEVGFERSRIRGLESRTPLDWRNELNLERGAAFGISAEFIQSAFFRPDNRSKYNKSLYHVGASTRPGNGLPMVLISAELIEERLIREGVIADTYVLTPSTSFHPLKEKAP
ncbi:MAG: phytoene desaturase family protein [Fimbriimonadaceae bacterium]|jgi:phytoene desaturase|nr:phytoene desaturase family protein [Fimbriimonadaceae bacterium]